MLRLLFTTTPYPTRGRFPDENYTSMRQGARFQAAVTLLDKILTSTAPADGVVTNYFRQCRYMGSTDRRIISEIVYQILRRYEELAWYITGISPNKPGWARILVLTYAHKIQNFTISEVQALCQKQGHTDKYDLEPLSTLELFILSEMKDRNLKKKPLTFR